MNKKNDKIISFNKKKKEKEQEYLNRYDKKYYEDNNISDEEAKLMEQLYEKTEEDETDKESYIVIKCPNCGNLETIKKDELKEELECSNCEKIIELKT